MDTHIYGVLWGMMGLECCWLKREREEEEEEEEGYTRAIRSSSFLIPSIWYSSECFPTERVYRSQGLSKTGCRVGRPGCMDLGYGSTGAVWNMVANIFKKYVGKHR